jgi:hypothetical protein
MLGVCDIHSPLFPKGPVVCKFPVLDKDGLFDVNSSERFVLLCGLINESLKDLATQIVHDLIEEIASKR